MSGHVSHLPEVGGRGATRFLLLLTKAFALAGGALFLAMIVLSVISIVGRKLWSAPINGDLELLQMGTGIAAAAFFPYCTLMGEHLRVEFFTAKLSVRAHCLLDGIANLLLAIAMGLMAWRTAIQVHELQEAGEVSVMRNIPIWIPVLCLVPSLALTALCGLNRALHHFAPGS
ncbi:MAG: TRAP transporter small permease [Comamonadaceae bacterium]|nr:TRAP transporter small permease [Comamonadaceae bacterium]